MKSDDYEYFRTHMKAFDIYKNNNNILKKTLKQRC